MQTIYFTPDLEDKEALGQLAFVMTAIEIGDLAPTLAQRLIQLCQTVNSPEDDALYGGMLAIADLLEAVMKAQIIHDFLDADTDYVTDWQSVVDALRAFDQWDKEKSSNPVHSNYSQYIPEFLTSLGLEG